MKTLLLPLLALLASAPALAQEQDGRDYRVRVGVGAQLRPEFIGADERDVAQLFDVDVARGDELFRVEAPDDSFGLRLISGDRFTAGPAANIEASRKDSDVGAPVGKVPTTFEAGAFAEFQPSDAFRFRGELLKGIGGHEGVTGSVGGDFIARDGDRYALTIGPRLLFSDARYQRAYFGVDAAAALATGLPLYRPGSGLHAVALASGLSYQFTPRFGLFGYARAERLVGDAAKSPVVRAFGSRNQLSAGAGLSYTFSIRR
jgi:outer membrane protein